MKKSIKKLTALALSFAMAFAPTVVSADSVTINGNGELEAFVGKNVFNVVLPSATSGAALDFVADPQGLLNSVEPAKHSVSAGAVYFKDATGAYNSLTSQALEVINKSSDDVNISLTVNVASDSVEIVSAGALSAEAATAQIALSVNSTTGGAVSTQNLASTTTVTASAVATADAYSIVTANSATLTGSSGGVTSTALSTTGSTVFYHYQLDQSLTNDDFEKVSFTFNGKCNTSDAWASVADDAISTSLTWTVTTGGANLPTVAGYIEPTGNDYYVGANSSDGFEGTVTKIVLVKNGTESNVAFTAYSDNWCKVLWDDLVSAGAADSDGKADLKVYTTTKIYTMTTTW